MASFLKYIRDDAKQKTGGQTDPALEFGRAHLDGMPYRGPAALLREEEYEDLTEVVHNGHVDVFDLSDPQHREKLEEIVDRATNGWYSIFKLVDRFVDQPDGSVKVFVFCIWTAPHKELASHRLPTGLKPS